MRKQKSSSSARKSRKKEEVEKEVHNETTNIYIEKRNEKNEQSHMDSKNLYIIGWAFYIVNANTYVYTLYFYL
jgi:hypothetical protein